MPEKRAQHAGASRSMFFLRDEEVPGRESWCSCRPERPGMLLLHARYPPSRTLWGDCPDNTGIRLRLLETRQAGGQARQARGEHLPGILRRAIPEQIVTGMMYPRTFRCRPCGYQQSPSPTIWLPRWPRREACRHPGFDGAFSAFPSLASWACILSKQAAL